MRISVALSVGSLLMITNLIFYVIASVIYNTKIAQTDMSLHSAVFAISVFFHLLVT